MIKGTLSISQSANNRPITLKIIKKIDIDAINFLLFIENSDNMFVNVENDFSSTYTFLESNRFNNVGRSVNVTINEVSNPNDIIRPKSMIGFMSLNTKDKNAHIVVRTVYIIGHTIFSVVNKIISIKVKLGSLFLN